MPRRVAATALLLVLAAAPALGPFCEARCAEAVAVRQHGVDAAHAHHSDAAAHERPQSTAGGLQSPVVETGSERACRSHLEVDLAGPERTVSVTAEPAPDPHRLTGPVAYVRRSGPAAGQRPPPESGAITPLRV